MKIFKKLENLFAAAAFAEEGEFDTARQIAEEEVSETKQAVRRPRRAGVGGRVDAAHKKAAPFPR